MGILVKYVPVGEFARRVNLISAVFAAITTANVFLLVYLWRGKVIAAINSGIDAGAGAYFLAARVHS